MIVTEWCELTQKNTVKSRNSAHYNAVLIMNLNELLKNQ